MESRTSIMSHAGGRGDMSRLMFIQCMEEQKGRNRRQVKQCYQSKKDPRDVQAQMKLKTHPAKYTHLMSLLGTLSKPQWKMLFVT